MPQGVSAERTLSCALRARAVRQGAPRGAGSLEPGAPAGLRIGCLRRGAPSGLSWEGKRAAPPELPRSTVTGRTWEPGDSDLSPSCSLSPFLLYQGSGAVAKGVLFEMMLFHEQGRGAARSESALPTSAPWLSARRRPSAPPCRPAPRAESPSGSISLGRSSVRGTILISSCPVGCRDGH